MIDTSAAAYGSYDPADNHISHFAVLKIETNPAFSDEQQMLAAGFLEGALTSADIWNQFRNLYATYNWKDGPPSCVVSSALSRHLESLRLSRRPHSSTSRRPTCAAWSPRPQTTCRSGRRSASS